MKTENVRIGSESQRAMTSIYPQRVRFGPFEADLESHELWRNGIRAKLGGQPFEILAALVDPARYPVSPGGTAQWMSRRMTLGPFSPECTPPGISRAAHE